MITAIRDGDGPCESSLGAAGAARTLADRLGATVYATCSLRPSDDIDRWVASLGIAGIDRIACARGADDEPQSQVAVHAELTRRLSPRLVLVPFAASECLEAISSALSTPVSELLDDWDGEGKCPLDLSSLPAVVPVRLEARAAPRGCEDIDVLFFDVEADADGEEE